MSVACQLIQLLSLLDTNEEPPTRGHRFNEADMPWYDPEAIQRRRPSCARTIQILEQTHFDVKSIKPELVNNGDRFPKDFPLSQWKNIIEGESVDLDCVFSSLYRVTPDEERKRNVRETTFTFGTTEPAKKIKTASDWSAAWRKASRAISFIFRHRWQELQDYADYIEGEFTAKVPGAHKYIIAYDRAVRSFIGAGQHILLTDLHRFTHIYSAYLLPGGIASGGQFSTVSGSRRDSRGSRTWVCNKFNAGTCILSDGKCHYRHICKKCGKGGHGRHACFKIKRL